MLNCIYVGIGGFAGSVLRYLIGLIDVKTESGFPIKTLLINLSGAFILGLIAALAEKWKITDSRTILMLKTGVCGGFTTFSTFAFESAGLINDGRTTVAVAYILTSVVFGILVVYAAQVIVR